MKQEVNSHPPLADSTLIEMYRKGETEAFHVLLKRYTRKIHYFACRFYYGGYQDYVQEGAIGLFHAVLRYRPERGASFRTFAEVHIRGQVINAAKRDNRQKHKFLNDSLSLDQAIYEGGDDNRIDFIRHSGPSPEETFFRNLHEDEERRKMHYILGTFLTSLERKALLRICDGQTYEAAANAIGVNVKAIDNAIRRAKRKLAKVCGRNEIGEWGLLDHARPNARTFRSK